MAQLRSRLFCADPRLEKTLVNDAAHVVPGDQGEFVSKIQYAVLVLEGGTIGAGELVTQKYGPETATAVLAYKKRRQIINRSYQQTADNIVGKMTIQSLDTEMLAHELRERLKVRRGVID